MITVLLFLTKRLNYENYRIILSKIMNFIYIMKNAIRNSKLSPMIKLA